MSIFKYPLYLLRTSDQVGCIDSPFDFQKMLLTYFNKA